MGVQRLRITSLQSGIKTKSQKNYTIKHITNKNSEAREK